MLILTRYTGQSIIIDDNIILTIVDTTSPYRIKINVNRPNLSKTFPVFLNDWRIIITDVHAMFTYNHKVPGQVFVKLEAPRNIKIIRKELWDKGIRTIDHPSIPL